MTRRVLLTGASGFVGRQILAALQSSDVSVRAVVRPASAVSLVHVGLEDVVQTDDVFGESPEWWVKTCRDVDTVIHAAWFAEPGLYIQSPKNLDCLRGTLQLASGCARAGVRRFVGIGTCSEYDMTEGNLSIETPLRPTTPYAGAKAATYQALSNCLPPLGVTFAWCRLFYLHGQGEDSRRLVPYLRSQLAAGEPAELSSGNQIRDYLDVSVAGRCIVKIALGEGSGAFNICSGQAQTVREIAEKIADEYGRRDLLRFGARPDNSFDPPRVVGIKVAAC